MLMKDENVYLVDIFFNKSKFYDNEFMLKLLFYYKNKTAIFSLDLNQQIFNERFKILLNSKEYSYHYMGILQYYCIEKYLML